MSELAIRIEGLGKRYRIGAQRAHYGSLRESISGAAAAAWRRSKALFSGAAPGAGIDFFWALRDVSLEVGRGEVVGIIGRNGAGKSTLLKILSRITEPTEGRAELRGRLGSLLEVGTGFHPELTGRENIYLSGAILGMRKAKIDRCFDEIVAYAEVEQFLETPVKRYSSGMYVRLGFAVAAHLDPEIMLVDEVLAVGDIGFQKKCLGTMGKVARGGRTVLFVSHNMAAIQSLCPRAILLEGGRVVADGPSGETIKEYVRTVEQRVASHSLAERTDRAGSGRLRIEAVEFLDPETKSPVGSLRSGSSVLVRMRYRCFAEAGIEDAVLSIAFLDRTGQRLFTCRNDVDGSLFRIRPGSGWADCLVERWPLNGGRYGFHVGAAARGGNLDMVENAGWVDVELGDYFGTGTMPPRGPSLFFTDQKWTGPAGDGP